MMSSALVVESWTWYALTVVVVGVRMVSRRMLYGGWKKLKIDDALMVLALVADTVLIVAMNILSRTNSNLIDPNDRTPLTGESIKEREFGSKLVLVVEQMQIFTIWTIKCCLLLIFSRLTTSLKYNWVVKAVGAYVVFGFVIMEVLYLAVWCRPFQQYWAVPPDNVQCSAATNHLITNAALNLTSDIMIILIPMPVVLQSTLPLKRKLVLCGVFGLGCFTILSAILNKYYSFTEPFGSAWTFWYIRESSTAIITANLPFTWTILQRVFNVRSFGERSDPSSGNARSRNTQVSHSARRINMAVKGDAARKVTRSESQEHMNDSFRMPLQIMKKQEIQITSTAREDADFGTYGNLQDKPVSTRENRIYSDANRGIPKSSIAPTNMI